MFIALTLTVFAILASTVVAIIWRNQRRIKTMHRKLPNFNIIPSVPLFGNFTLFTDTSPPAIFATFVQFHRLYGKNLIAQSTFNKMLLHVTDPKTVEQVINTKTIEKSTMYHFMKPWLGTGLVVATGKKWARQRKIITPTFHFKILEDFLVIMNHQADILMDKLAEYSDTGKDCDIYEPVALCALDIISESAMGVRLNAQSNPNSEFVQATKEMLEIIFRRLFSWEEFDWMFRFNKLAPQQDRVVKILHNFTSSVILQRKKQLEDEQAQQKLLEKHEESDLYGKRKMSLLDMLLSVSVDGQPLSNTDIREEVDTFLLAGQDTTTSCISMAVYHLSRNIAIQQKVYEEISTVVGAEKAMRSELTNGMLQQLKYLDMTIKEVLRITPSVPIVGRKAVDDMVIDGIPIPKGVEISIIITAMHNDPDLYPEPERFDPERFNEENQAARQPYSYLPFSAGSRNCIGQRYALLEVKTVLVKLLANFKLLPCDEANLIQLKTDLTLKPVNGAFVKLVKRCYQ